MTGPSPTLAGPEIGRVPLLEARGLTKHFPIGAGRFSARRAVVHAVDDVSLTLPAGSITAIVGESGSGKSTLAKLLARLIRPTSGHLALDGREISAGSRVRRSYARQVQLVLQDPFASLNPIHDVRYHLVRPLKLHGVPGNGGAANGARDSGQRSWLDQAVADLLSRVALAPPEVFAAKYPHELSGGQRQRVAIARALAVEPAILLADEPVSMLDVSIRLDILNLLLRLKEEEGLALLYITHDIASARYFADQTLVMYAGQMVEGGPSEAVTQDPQHPYTRLLLSAAPDPDRMGAGGIGLARSPARGEIPSLITPPSGCRFHPRCPHAMPVCRERFPGRTELGGGQWTHCFLYGEGDRQP